MLSKGLIKKSGLYFIGNISTKILNFLILPIYAYHVNVADFGNYDLMNTFASLLSPVIFISIWDSILRFLLDTTDYESDKVLSTSVIFSLGILLIITVFLLIYSIFYNKSNFIIGIYVLLITYAFVAIWQYSARGLKENKIYTKSAITSAVVNFTLSIILLVVFHMGILSIILATVAGSIAGIIVIELKINLFKKISLSKFNIPILKILLKYSWPLVINAIAAWGILSVCRVIVALKLGSEINGIYAYATKFNQFIMVFGQIFYMAWIEEAIVSTNKENSEEYFSKSIQSISHILVGVLIVAGPIIALYYYIISNTSYSDAISIFPILLMVPVIQTISSNIGSVFQIKNKTNIIFYTTICGAIITILISWIFIDRYGLISVAIAQFIGMLTMLIIRKVITNGIMKINLDSKFLIISLIYYFISVYIAINSNVIVKCAFILINTIIAVALNRNNLSQIIIMAKNKKNKKLSV